MVLELVHYPLAPFLLPIAWVQPNPD
ncbi:uncharacterized protein METZ01_LOCUS258374, partial [marine metagenome]